jgi:lipoprotein NlpD
MSVRILFISVCAGLCLSLLSACSSPLSSWDPDDYPVKSGDTIFSIAWKYELDPFELARWNNLSSPYVIRPGQRLKMEPVATTASGGSQSAKQTSKRSSSGTVTVRKGDTLYSIAQRHNISTQKLASINGLRSPYTIQPGQTLKLKASSSKQATRSAKSPGTKQRPTTTSSSTAYSKKVTWRWPVKGQVISTYKYRKSDRKGIKIAGKEGKPVKAAASGKVVYSGNGLISYGNLVIIKHNRTYLSAYAHNRKLLVKEGDMIKSGQKIAELGKTGTDSPQLHFEIRKNGKPVNPLNYLPRS